MKLVHPQGPYNNLPAEDVFFAVDDMGTTHGTGCITYMCQPSLYPDCPINLYFSLDGHVNARYLLFGALMARARQIRDYDPNVRVRVYTAVAPDDAASIAFYTENGMQMSDTEQRMLIPLPAGDGVIPMSCTVAATPLDTQEQRDAFLLRMQSNDLGYITADLLAAAMQQPAFHVLGLYRNGTLVSECMMAGSGGTAELYGIYTAPTQRRQGFAQALLHRTMAVFSKYGVNQFLSSLLTRSEPSRKLLQRFGAQSFGVTAVYPELFL